MGVKRDGASIHQILTGVKEPDGCLPRRDVYRECVIGVNVRASRGPIDSICRAIIYSDHERSSRGSDGKHLDRACARLSIVDQKGVTVRHVHFNSMIIALQKAG